MQLTERTMHHLIEQYYRMGYDDKPYTNHKWLALVKNNHPSQPMQLRKPVVLELLSHAYLQGKHEARLRTTSEPPHSFQTLLNQELDYAKWRVDYEKA